VLFQSVVNEVVIIWKLVFLISFWKEETSLDRAVAKILVSPNISLYQRICKAGGGFIHANKLENCFSTT
jgi:hypothetical protein